MKRFLVFFLAGLQLAAVAQKPTDTMRIIGVGDIMLGTSYPSNYLPPEDGRLLLSPVEAILLDADFTIGNYEGTLFNGEGKPKKCTDSVNCYVFKTPEHYAQYLQKAGFDAMSVANNHSGDFGTEGRDRTIQALTGVGIAAAGTNKHPFALVRKNGILFGLAAFAPNAGTLNLHDTTGAKKIIAKLDSICDIVIVSFHGGGEGLAWQHVTRAKEMFLGEDRGNVYQFSRMAIDAGADVVFGHGPHVTRAVDLYRNRFIIYSLGNFATYGRFNLKGSAGIAPIMKVMVNKKGEFLAGEIIPVKQVGEGGPKVDGKGAVIRKVRQLTTEDFPESALEIKPNGRIEKKKTGKLQKERAYA